MQKTALAIVIGLAACGGPGKQAPQGAPVNNAAPVQAAEPAAAPADRCTAVADHFEPWHSNPDWDVEVAPRDVLIADCRKDHWSAALIDCMLGSNSPLELDHCMSVE